MPLSTAWFFARSVVHLLATLEHDTVVCARDVKQNFRKTLFPAYKEERLPMPQVRQTTPDTDTRACGSVCVCVGGRSIAHTMHAHTVCETKPLMLFIVSLRFCQGLRQQMGLCIEVLESLGIPVISEDGIEADDLLATAAHYAAQRGDWEVRS